MFHKFVLHGKLLCEASRMDRQRDIGECWGHMGDSQGHYRGLLKSTRRQFTVRTLGFNLEIILIDCVKTNTACHFWGASLCCLLWMFSPNLQSVHQASLYLPQKNPPKMYHKTCLISYKYYTKCAFNVMMSVVDDYMY